MKTYTFLIHTLVRTTRTESIFAALGKLFPFFLKFIPLPTEYATDEKRTVTREYVIFDLQLSDYMQWHIFAQQPDSSWKIALDRITDSSIVLDVGANCGAFSLKLAQASLKKGIRNHKIYAFEPNPVVCDFFNNNLSLNLSLQHFIRLQPIGLGKTNEMLAMVFSTGNSGGGRVVEAQSGQLSVTIQTLDSFVETHQLKNIAFIKIDVEGFEPFVIEGAKKTIRQFKPAIFIEITDSWFKEKGSSEAEVVGYFLDEGYQLFIEGHTGLVNFSFEKSRSLPQYNLVALPK